MQTTRPKCRKKRQIKATRRRRKELCWIFRRCALGKELKPVIYTYLPWGWITDFDFIRHLQPTIQVFGSPHFWLSSQLGLHANDVLVIPDTSKYQYRFTDEIVQDPSLDQRTFTNATYSEDIALRPLADPL